jgi:hypothetical protein
MYNIVFLHYRMLEIQLLNNARIEPIPKDVVSLQIIRCDFCKIELATHNLYKKSDIEDTPFLKRVCQKCVRLSKQPH